MTETSTSTTTAATALSVRLVGGPTLAFEYAGLTFLTDPTFDEPGVYPGRVDLHKLTGPALSPDELGRIDVVLLSHDEHADNLDHAGRDLLARVPKVFSTPGAAERIPGVTGLENWQTVQVGDVEVTGVPALHGPEGAEAVTGVVTGFVLRAPGEPVVYVSGDNASVDVVREVAERVGPIEVAILFAGGANVGAFGDVDITLNSGTAIAAAIALGDALIVPVHAEGWGHFTEGVDELARAFARAGLADRLRVPVRGGSVSVG
ncbi:MBL fold metallo-hydrolase [Agromyces sp. H3Y2-19a]|uniref:MBL fold metallo-hydrolase n=1 Tax=Agromyces TaxID=33877 RepID=UPI0023B8BA24|nr:MBL fold metallo-hydrolase [Agromyces chromiiresistens]MDF0514363.1 MBL fold metallo-hydrolase [Agromyces chromiiresistens]